MPELGTDSEITHIYIYIQNSIRTKTEQASNANEKTDQSSIIDGKNQEITNTDHKTLEDNSIQKIIGQGSNVEEKTEKQSSNADEKAQDINNMDHSDSIENKSNPVVDH